MLVVDQPRTLLGQDFVVCYHRATGRFIIESTHDDCCESFYLFVERWVYRKVEQLNGDCFEPTPDHLDDRDVGRLWLVDPMMDACHADLNVPIERQIARLGQGGADGHRDCTVGTVARNKALTAAKNGESYGLLRPNQWRKGR